MDEFIGMEGEWIFEAAAVQFRLQCPLLVVVGEDDQNWCVYVNTSCMETG